MDANKQQQFGIELTALLNRYSAENDSDTPDFILSAYLISCLNAFHNTVQSRRHWWGDKETSGFHPHFTDQPAEAPAPVATVLEKAKGEPLIDRAGQFCFEQEVFPKSWGDVVKIVRSFAASETAPLLAENERLRDGLKSLGIELGVDDKPLAWDYDKCNLYEHVQALRDALTDLVARIERHNDGLNGWTGFAIAGNELAAAKRVVGQGEDAAD